MASRREAEDLIRQGRVTVDGRRVELGARASPLTQRIELDGERVNPDSTKKYLMLNKPPGIVTSTKDPEGRPTVLGLIRSSERVFPVGRLDLDTEGLLLLTNDGELTHRLTHPSFEVTKTYVAEVDGAPDSGLAARLEEGVKIDAGRKAKALGVRLLANRGGRRSRAVVEITIHEGRKHVVRKMLEQCGLPVRKLVRTQIGGLRMEGLKPGEFRDLTRAEVAKLYRQVGL